MRAVKDSKLLTVYIGFDQKESAAFYTCCSSIIHNSSGPISIVPLKLSLLQNIYSRIPDPKSSNEFSYTRFMVPFLNNYTGLAVYLDCDMVVTGDLVKLCDDLSNSAEKALWCVKHDYVPRDKRKYLGNIQESYPRKNWSSFVVWNCSHSSNQQVTPDFVNAAEPATLHRFLWCDDEEIGALGLGWNYLVGEYDCMSQDEISNFHFTLGGPYFSQYSESDFADVWWAENSRMTYVEPD